MIYKYVVVPNYLYRINTFTSPDTFNNNNSSIYNRIKHLLSNDIELSEFLSFKNNFIRLSIDDNWKIIDIYKYPIEEIKKLMMTL